MQCSHDPMFSQSKRCVSSCLSCRRRLHVPCVNRRVACLRGCVVENIETDTNSRENLVECVHEQQEQNEQKEQKDTGASAEPSRERSLPFTCLHPLPITSIPLPLVLPLYIVAAPQLTWILILSKHHHSVLRVPLGLSSFPAVGLFNKRKVCVFDLDVLSSSSSSLFVYKLLCTPWSNSKFDNGFWISKTWLIQILWSHHITMASASSRSLASRGSEQAAGSPTEEAATSSTTEYDEHGHGHFFYKKTFPKPVYCHHCTDMLWGLIKQGYICEVCNFVVHDRCINSVVSPCSTVAANVVKNPVPHCWTEPQHLKRKYCSVCRRKIDPDINAVRCEVCEYCVHMECQDFSVANCKECATFVPGQENDNIVQYHHWREGNLPVNSKCYASKCKKTCWSGECLSGMRCEWCGWTVSIALLIVASGYPGSS